MRYRLLTQALDQLSASLLLGSHDARLRAQFALYNPQFISHYYYTPINHPKLKRSIESILNHSGIDERQKGRFRDAPLNIYEFLQYLEKLTQDEYKRKRIHAFIKRIKEKNKTRLIILGTFIAGLGSSALSTTFSLFSWSQLQTILSATLFFPVVGLVSTSLLTLYGIYQNVKSSTPFWSRVRDNTFLLANAALNLAAYIVLISAASAISPIASGLFIAASCINAIKETFILIQHAIKQKEPRYDSEQSLVGKQAIARERMEFKKHRNALAINLSTAVVMVGIMAFWSLVPGGFMITAIAIAAIGAVALLQKKALSKNEKRMKEQLDKEFDRLEKEDEKTESLTDDLGAVDNCSKAHTTPTFRGLSAESIDPADKPRGVGFEVECQQTLDNEDEMQPLLSQKDEPERLSRPSRGGLFTTRQAAGDDDFEIELEPAPEPELEPAPNLA